MRNVVYSVSKTQIHTLHRTPCQSNTGMASSQMIFDDNTYPGRRCLRYGLNEDFIGQNSKLDVHQKFFQNPKIYIWNMQKIEEKKFFTPGTPPVPGVKVFFKKKLKMPYLWCLWTISNDLGVKMGVLEAKKLIGDSLTCPARVLHVPGTCHVLLMNCCISVVSCSILVILESKWWFLRPRNWLVIVSRALHVSYTCQARVTCF